MYSIIALQKFSSLNLGRKKMLHNHPESSDANHISHMDYRRQTNLYTGRQTDRHEETDSDQMTEIDRKMNTNKHKCWAAFIETPIIYKFQAKKQIVCHNQLTVLRK